MTDPDNDAAQEQRQCRCGALTGPTEKRCRKCRARSRYHHRRRYQHRDRVGTPRNGGAGAGPKGR